MTLFHPWMEINWEIVQGGRMSRADFLGIIANEAYTCPFYAGLLCNLEKMGRGEYLRTMWHWEAMGFRSIQSFMMFIEVWA